jgi:ubiquinone/menaquinone biosynthesis C-methylase UbiE
MPAWLLYTFVSVVAVLSFTALFFFTVTRGALLMRAAMPGTPDDADHVYPIYSNMRLIRMIDFQPIIAAILLFQYDRLVSAITAGLLKTKLTGKNVLITSCAFGNVIPRVVSAAVEAGARRVLIADIIKNELDHAQSKLLAYPGKVQFLEENATAMKLADASVDANVIFFLLHELPHHLKGQALKEAGRVLTPGGKLYLAEFHRPDLWVLRALSWTYFKVFEPLGLALWDSHDPLKQLEAMGGFTCERRTVFFGNFQVIVATKNA